jgi:hypothetical protein
MLNRKGAVSLAMVAAVTASAGTVLADNTTLTLEPTVATMQAAAAPARRPLMSGLDRVGVAQTLDSYNINIYGWVEASYTYNHRHSNKQSSVDVDEPANKVGPNGIIPFNHQAGDTIMGNQLALRIERTIADTTKVDVGGLLELMYGQDAAAIHANGLEYGHDGNQNRFHPNYQFDIPQAYLDISVGVKGLTFRVGKFYTLIGFESIKPDENPLFSHSYLFYAAPFTHLGVLASYQVNDQWKVTVGGTRGWDQSVEDGFVSDETDGETCAIDALFKVEYNPNAQWTIALAGSIGPNNGYDTSHYRTAINPTMIYRATDQLTFAAEVLYVYDGNYKASSPAGYGDVWGAAVYASYKINDMFTVNARAEKFHDYRGVISGSAITSADSVNIYAVTLGVTITPFPNDPLGAGLKIRPELRYDYSEDRVFQFGAADGGHRDQFTMGVDVIYAF